MDTNIIHDNFVICTVKYTHLCIRHGVQTSKVQRRSHAPTNGHGMLLRTQNILVTSLGSPLNLSFHKALQVVRPISQIPRECHQRQDVKNQYWVLILGSIKMCVMMPKHMLVLPVQVF
jgi:hypothetical protein